MTSRKAFLRVAALFLVAGAAVACSHQPEPEAPTVPDIRSSVATLGIPACDAYVSAIETECFGQHGQVFPPGLVGLVSERVGGWQHDVNEPGGRARVAEGCASAREAVHTFHCEVR
jgi:hypothetical protein